MILDPEPFVAKVNEYLLVGDYCGRRLTAVRNGWGWNVQWRQANGLVRWRNFRTEKGVIAYLKASLLAGAL